LLEYQIKPNKDTVLINDNQFIVNDIGIHNLIYSDSTNDVLAVNIKKSELLQAIGSEDSLLDAFPNAELITNMDSFHEILSKLIVGIEIWRYFLFMTIILVIVEMYLSNIYYTKND